MLKKNKRLIFLGPNPNAIIFNALFTYSIVKIITERKLED